MPRAPSNSIPVHKEEAWAISPDLALEAVQSISDLPYQSSCHKLWYSF